MPSARTFASISFASLLGRDRVECRPSSRSRCRLRRRAASADSPRARKFAAAVAACESSRNGPTLRAARAGCAAGERLAAAARRRAAATARLARRRLARVGVRRRRRRGCGRRLASSAALGRRPAPTTTPLLRRSAGSSLTSVMPADPSSVRTADAASRENHTCHAANARFASTSARKMLRISPFGCSVRPTAPANNASPSSTKSALSSTSVSSQPRSAGASPPVRYTSGASPSARLHASDGAIERRREREHRAVADGRVGALAEQIEAARRGRRRERRADVARVAVERGREQLRARHDQSAEMRAVRIDRVERRRPCPRRSRTPRRARGGAPRARRSSDRRRAATDPRTRSARRIAPPARATNSGATRRARCDEQLGELLARRRRPRRSRRSRATVVRQRGGERRERARPSASRCTALPRLRRAGRPSTCAHLIRVLPMSMTTLHQRAPHADVAGDDAPARRRSRSRSSSAPSASMPSAVPLTSPATSSSVTRAAAQEIGRAPIGAIRRETLRRR